MEMVTVYFPFPSHKDGGIKQQVSAFRDCDQFLLACRRTSAPETVRIRVSASLRNVSPRKPGSSGRKKKDFSHPRVKVTADELRTIHGCSSSVFFFFLFLFLLVFFSSYFWRVERTGRATYGKKGRKEGGGAANQTSSFRSCADGRRE